jgi:hypothetical protein
MRKIAQISLLIICMFVASPISAKWHNDIKEMEKAVERFIKDKNVSLSDPRLTAKGQPIDKKSINTKDEEWCVDFTCTDAAVLKNLWMTFMQHLDKTSFMYCSCEPYLQTEPLKLLKLDGNDWYIVLTGEEKNRYVLTFEGADGKDYGFQLNWDDLQDDVKKGYLSRFAGYNPKVITAYKEGDRTTMDSVRTAIKIGEVVRENKNHSKIEIDTTYIDGKWAVSTKFHRSVLRAMDGVSDHQDGFPALVNKVNELVNRSKDASETQLASIGFALKREASRYELLLTPEQFAMLWKGIYNLESKAMKADKQILDYFKVAENILRGKVNESKYLEWTDAKRHKFLQKIGFTVTKHENGRPYFAVWGKHYTGNPDLEYLDACADADGVLKYHAQHVEKDLKPGIYRLTAAGRTSYSGYTGAFIFAQTEGKPLLKEIPACDDHEGDIWKDAAIRVKEAEEKGQQISPQDVRIALANGGMGYGWNKIVIDNIVVRKNETVTYGVSCDEDFTGKHFTGRWLSAVDFVLERVDNLPDDKK